MALGRVYAFGPTFRAEKSKTRRHLTEFWMVEPEMAYADLNDTMDLAEDLIVSVVARVLETRQRELVTLERDQSKLTVVQRPFPRITYDEAITRLKDAGQPVEWGGDFGGTDETVLSQQFDRPVCVHRYPSQVKAFYMKPDPERPEVALGVDVIAPEGYGEIIGGGQRVDDYDLLLKRIEEHKLPREAFEWYLDLRRFGSVPHAGFGMGIERMVTWLCGLEHVRETIPYPRMLYRLLPVTRAEAPGGARPEGRASTRPRLQPAARGPPVDGQLLVELALEVGLTRALDRVRELPPTRRRLQVFLHDSSAGHAPEHEPAVCVEP